MKFATYAPTPFLPVYRGVDGYSKVYISENEFMGEKISTWITIAQLAAERNISVEELARLIERLDPIGKKTAWVAQFGILAQIKLYQEAQAEG